MRPVHWVGYSLVLIYLLPAGGCNSKSDPDQAQGPPASELAVAKVATLPLVEWDEYTGRLDAINSVDVRARVSGYLQDTYFDEGQRVERGDLLAIIDPRPFQAELTAARARVTEAKARLAEAESLKKQSEAAKEQQVTALKLALKRLDRQQQLDARGATSQEQVDTQQAESAQAAAAVEAANATVETANAAIATANASIATAMAQQAGAELDLHYTEIRAPIAGRISRRFVTQGNLIDGGSSGSALLTRIVSMNPIHAYFDANEQEFLKYTRLAQSGKRGSSREVKNPVLVGLVDEEGYPHKGHMDFVDNRVDPNTGTIRGRAILSNDQNILTPGLFVRLRLPGSGRYTAVLVPDSAIGSDQSEKYVYVMTEGEPVRTVVKLGPISHGLRIIREGLNGDETIVVRGLQSIRPGGEFKTVDEPLELQPAELPDQYEPVPRDQWLTEEHEPIPKNVPQNAAPYQTLDDRDQP